MEERPGDGGGAPSDCWDAWRGVLALLRIGFSLNDVRNMTMADAVAYTDLAAEGAAPAQRRGPRRATQADIDAFLG